MSGQKFQHLEALYENKSPAYKPCRRTWDRDRIMQRTNGRRVRRARTSRFAVTFDGVRYLVAASLRWLADVIDRGRLR